MSDYKINVVVGLKDELTRPLSGMQSALGGLGGLAKGALVTGVGAAVAGVAALGAVLVSSTKEAMAAQEVQAQLAAVLESTGGAAGMSAEEVNTLADSLSRVTRYDDEAIVSAQSLLLTFRNVGEEVFPSATEAALNMSTALGQDLQASVMQLGKALNDPIAGMSALRRVGVQFTDDQEAMIKAMVEAGDVMGAQKLILGELELEFGGAARAAGQTFGGQMDILKTQMGNVKEQIGTALLPVLTQLATTMGPKLVAAAQGFADFTVNSLIPAIEDLAAWWRDTLYPALVVVGDWMQANLIPVLQVVWQWLSTNLPPVIQTLATIWETILLPALQTVAKIWREDLLPAITEVWGFIQDPLIPVISALANVFDAVLGLAITVLQGLWQNVLLPALREVWQFVSTHLAPVFEKLGSVLSGPMSNALKMVKPLFDAVARALGGVEDKLRGVVDWLQTLAEKFRNIHLPDWMTPGSPTPWELGLRGVSEALAELSTTSLPKLQAELRIGEPRAITWSAAQMAQQPASSTIVQGDRFYMTVTDQGTARLVAALISDQKARRLESSMGL